MFKRPKTLKTVALKAKKNTIAQVSTINANNQAQSCDLVLRLCCPTYLLVELNLDLGCRAENYMRCSTADKRLHAVQCVQQVTGSNWTGKLCFLCVCSGQVRGSPALWLQIRQISRFCEVQNNIGNTHKCQKIWLD